MWTFVVLKREMPFRRQSAGDTVIFLRGSLNLRCYPRHRAGLEEWTMCTESGAKLAGKFCPFFLFTEPLRILTEITSHLCCDLFVGSFWGRGDNWFKKHSGSLNIYKAVSSITRYMRSKLVWFKGQRSPDLTINPTVMGIVAVFSSNTPRIMGQHCLPHVLIKISDYLVSCKSTSAF
jgi:hypothetical protein